MRTFWRLAVVQTPMTALGSVTLVGIEPLAVRFVDRQPGGRWLWTLTPAVELTPAGHLAQSGVHQSEGVVVLLERPQIAEVEMAPRST